MMMPDAHDADRFRAVVLERFNMSLGAGLGRFKGRAFRIGHLGDFNDLMLMGTLCGVEMGLALAGVPSRPGGVEAAMGESSIPTADSELQRESLDTRGSRTLLLVGEFSRRRSIGSPWELELGVGSWELEVGVGIELLPREPRRALVQERGDPFAKILLP